MKLNKWLYGAAAALLLGACSDNFDDGPNTGKPTEEGQGYIGINIQLPTVNSTRANDEFGDGELSEYRVDDAIILLFQGADEKSATFTGAFNLQEAEPIDDENNPQITRHSIRVANVTGVGFDNKLYALVMVNGIANGLYSKATPEAEWMTKLTNDKDEDGNFIRKGKTIQEFQETVLSKDKKLFEQSKRGQSYASNIFMTNSPLTKEKGGAFVPSNNITSALPVLVELNTTVYADRDDAIKNPAGTIHVERAVGKVTCSSFTKSTELRVTVNDYEYDLEVDDIWWAMAQDMADTYVVRNTNRNPIGSNDNYMWRWNYASSLITNDDFRYRMLGSNPIAVKVNGVNEEFYRPYFCQVPGYGKKKGETNNYEDKNFLYQTMELENAVHWTKSTQDGKAFTGPGAFYPRENTFPVEYMKYANTTRVGFWVTFNFVPVMKDAPELDMKGKNFYISGLDHQTLYLDDENGDDPLTNHALASLADKNKYSALWKAIDDAIDKEEAGSITIDIRDLLTFEYNKDSWDNDGLIEIDKVTFKEIDEIKKKYAQFKDVPNYEFSENDITAFNNLGEFHIFEGGKAFYEVRIKHFGDDNTPWPGESLTTATTIDESYGDVTHGAVTKNQRDQNYLGRYGIVRNNWYDIAVTKIAHLGDPRDPAKWSSSWPGKPDDNKDQYIAVELRVLSWAKRSQNIEF